MKKKLITFFITILSFSCVLTLNAEPLNNQFPPLKLVTMDLAPYGWIDEYGKPHGIVYELTEEIGKRSGLAYTHKIRPFSRMLLELKTGSVDLLSSQAHQKALNSGDKLAIQFYINVIAGTKKESNIKTLKDFKDKNLIYHNGSSYKELEGLPKNITYARGYKQSLMMLNKRQKFHGAIFSEPAYYYWMKDMGLSPSDFGPVVMIKENIEQWLFVRKNLSPEVRKILKKVVEEIQNEGFYESLLKKYGKI